MPSRAEENIRTYFKFKAQELRVQAKYAICEHAGLVGGHREEIQRLLFGHLLPRRFSVGRGMVYGTFHRSREADIVIWDSMNFPSIPLADHAMYFAESVRSVLECKSAFSAQEFEDVQAKTKSVRDIVVESEDSPSIATRVEMLEHRVSAMQAGGDFLGMMQLSHQIGTGAIFLTGGGSYDFRELAEGGRQKVDDCWPDITLLLEPGIILQKEYVQQEGYMGGSGHLSKYVFGEDALLVFLSLLLRLLFDRSTALEPLLDLLRYARRLQGTRTEWTLPFPLTRAVPQNHPFVQQREGMGGDHPVQVPSAS